MFEIIFIHEGSYIVSEDFQECFFEEKQLCQVPDDSICGGRVHLKQEGVQIHEVCTYLLQGALGDIIVYKMLCW